MATSVLHGAYARTSPFEGVTQHRYGCTDCEATIQGYCELLSIPDPPAGSAGIIIHFFWNSMPDLMEMGWRGGTWTSVYFEYTRLEDAENAYPEIQRLFVPSSPHLILRAFEKAVYQLGFICAGNTQTPWFYNRE